MMNRRFSKMITIGIAITMVLILTSCNRKNVVNTDSTEKTHTHTSKQQNADGIAESNARLMLKKYNLHPIGNPKINRFVSDVSSEIYKSNFKLTCDYSAKIGLDMRKYENKELDTLVLKLKERQQYQQSNTQAWFQYDNKGIIRGAVLCLPLVTPGITALNDKSRFMPASLKPEKLIFNNIVKIEILHHGSISISNPKDISNIISLMEKSKPEKTEDHGPALGDERYRFNLQYDDGPIVYGDLYTHNSRDVLKLDPFWNWHYSPTAELKTNIKELINSASNQ